MASYETRLRMISESSVNVSNNTSYVTVVLEFRRTDYQYYGMNLDGNAYWNMTVDGQSTGNINFTFNWTVPQYEWKEVGRRGFTIPHNTDGSKSINMSGTIYFGSGVAPGTLSGSGSATLTKIARGSTFGAITGNMIGSQISVSFNSASGNHLHMLWYKTGSLDWIHAISNRTSTSPITFTLPLNLCAQLPNATSGILRLYMETYDTNGNLVGNGTTESITVYVPASVVPSISSIAISEGGNLPAEFSGLYVRGHSRFHVITTAAGAYGSTIKSTRVKCLGQNYNGANITTGIITASDIGNTVYVDATVTDSRGKTATLRKNVTITPYNGIKIHSISVARSGTGSTALTIKSKFDIPQVENKNKKSYAIEICKHGTTTWTTLTSGSVYAYDNTYTAPDGTAAVDLAYSIRLTVSDSFGSAYATTDVGTVYKIMNINSSKKGIAFGKFSEKDIFECAMPAEFSNFVPAVIEYQNDDNDGKNFEAWLDQQLKEMPWSTVKLIAWSDYPFFSGAYYAGWLYKHDDGNYAALFSFNYTGAVIRRRNAGVWGPFERVKIGNYNDEYLVEEGSNLSGGYRKWNSGKLEQWIDTTITYPIPSAYGSLYQNVYNWKYPIPFLQTPDYAVCSRAQWETGASWGSTAGMTNMYLTIRIYDIQQRPDGKVALSAFAIGKWK